MKILLSGDVLGDLDALYKRVQAVNKSMGGAFEVLFCVGKFLSSKNGGVSILDEFKSGGKTIPIPTYFFESGLLSMPDDWPAGGGEILPNLNYMGPCGFEMVQGLAVGFLSDSADEQDMKEKMAPATENPGYVGADLLLSSSWPRGLDVNMAQEAVDALAAAVPGAAGALAAGRAAAAAAAAALRPRYHLAAGEGIFFQRQPYRNTEKLPNRKKVHITRFISLGKVAQTKDKARKWLHALDLALPAAAMPARELAREPPGTTACPYLRRSRAEGPDGQGLKRKAEGVGFSEAAARRIEKQEGRRRRGGGACDGGGGTGAFFFGDAVARRGNRGPKENPEDELLQKMAAEDPSCVKVFVGNLPLGTPVDPDQLSAVFSQVGTVAVARIPSDKTFGFVEMGSHEEAARAVRTLNGTPLAGRPLTIRWARPSQPARVAVGGGGPRRGGGGGGGARRGECWFCLASPGVEAHLVASIGEELYLSLPKGALVEDHVQLIPITHVARHSGLPPEAQREARKYKAALQEYYNARGMALVTIERNMAKDAESSTAHMFIECMPVELEKLDTVKRAFQEEGEATGCAFEDVDENTELASLLSREQKYFLVEIYPARGVRGASRLLHWLEDSISASATFGLQFGREVMARCVYGCPDRANWKNCKLTTEEETKQTAQFKKAFGRYDFTL